MKLNKLFIVRKYVWAADTKQAISKERKASVDDVWVDDEWKKQQELRPKSIGFKKK